jgi:hypothetical protein
VRGPDFSRLLRYPALDCGPANVYMAARALDRLNNAGPRVH